MILLELKGWLALSCHPAHPGNFSEYVQLTTQRGVLVHSHCTSVVLPFLGSLKLQASMLLSECNVGAQMSALCLGSW